MNLSEQACLAFAESKNSFASPHSSPPSLQGPLLFGRGWKNGLPQIPTGR